MLVRDAFECARVRAGCESGAGRERVGSRSGCGEKKPYQYGREAAWSCGGGNHIESLATLQSDPQGPLVRIQLVKLRRPRDVTVDTGHSENRALMMRCSKGVAESANEAPVHGTYRGTEAGAEDARRNMGGRTLRSMQAT